MGATTRGTGELIAAAVAAGARRVLVGVGGSATTDGGSGRARGHRGGRRTRAGPRWWWPATSQTLFVDAAELFGPQKGATPAQVATLRAPPVGAGRRAVRRATGSTSPICPGRGRPAAWPGGWPSLGARLVPGFDVVAEAVGLDARVGRADLVVTGEGRLDASSWAGKVVGGVPRPGPPGRVPVLVVAGAVGPRRRRAGARRVDLPADVEARGWPTRPACGRAVTEPSAEPRRGRLADGAGARSRAARPAGGDGGARQVPGRQGPARAARPQHVGGLGPQLGQGPVAVDPHAQVDLGHLLDAEAVGHVDEQAQLHAVAGGEARLVEHGPGRGRLAGQGLAHPGQLREEQVDDGSGHELGHPARRPPARRGGVARRSPSPGPRRLPGRVEERAEQPGHEVGAEVLDVGVEEDEELAVGLARGPRHGLALAPARRSRAATTRAPARPGHRGGVVGRPVVDHHDLVDEVDARRRR